MKYGRLNTVIEVLFSFIARKQSCDLNNLVTQNPNEQTALKLAFDCFCGLYHV